MESSQDPARIPTPPPNPTSDDELTFSDLEGMSDDDLELFRDEMDPGDLPSPRSIINVPRLRF